MSLSSRDFQRAAAQRLATSQFLMESGSRYNVDATYLAGYAIECALKALVLELTPEATRLQTLRRITAGKKMHNPEVLAGILADLGSSVPIDLMRRIQRSKWSVDLRYDYGHRDTGETRGFLKTANKVFDWVEGQLP